MLFFSGSAYKLADRSFIIAPRAEKIRHSGCSFSGSYNKKTGVNPDFFICLL